MDTKSFLLNLFLIGTILFIPSSLIAQNNTSSKNLGIKILFNDSNLKLDSIYKIGSDSIIIENIKFYLCNLKFKDKENNILLEFPQMNYLIDYSNKTTCSIPYRYELLPNDVILSFDLGVDSITNTSGALGGDLDPTKGMYWTWQSGYINFKLEGKSNRCKTKANEFQFHLGGYSYPYNSLRHVELVFHPYIESGLNLNISKVLNQIDLNTQNHIMSPGREAVNFSKVIADLIEID